MPAVRVRQRRDRLDRFRRIGLGDFNAAAFLAPAAVIASPVTAPQGLEPAALIAVVSELASTPIAGVIFKTGGPTYFLELSMASGNLRLRATSNSVLEIDETVDRDSADFQPHTYVVAVDPAYDDAGAAKLAVHVWVDGRTKIFALGTTADDPASGWAVDTEAWEYGQLTNQGTVALLELQLGEAALPGVF